MVEGSWEMEFVREVRTDTSRAMQLCKSFSFSFLIWLCKFFQGIDKMFFISAARPEESALRRSFLLHAEIFYCVSPSKPKVFEVLK